VVYARGVIRVLAVAAVAVALAVASASAAVAASPRYAFGRAGGNIVPFTVTIWPTGAVAVTGPARVGRRSLSRAQLAALAATVARGRLTRLPVMRFCSGSHPDFALHFVTAGGRTVFVRGSCSPRLSHVWNVLAAAVRLAQ
jgi:hypothetical protein